MQDLFGVGIYTIPEASRLTHIPTPSIKRWIKGYDYTRDGVHKTSKPLWKHDIETIGEITALSFRDLMELLFVNAFRKHGVSWKEIRAAAEKASEFIDSSHPFSTKRFKTDGKKIIVEYAEQTRSKALLELVSGQYAIEKIIGPHLLSGFEYSSSDNGIVRWYPIPRSRKVVIDPKIKFGRPVVLPAGIPTDVLYRAYKAEGSKSKVAQWYKVNTNTVKVAVKFEEELVA